MNRILMWWLPDSRCGSAPRSSRADSHIVLLVDVLQKFDIDPLVSLLGISEIAKILSQKQVKKMLQYNINTHTHTQSFKYWAMMWQCECFQVCFLIAWWELTLLVAQNCLCPSLISGLNFCSSAFCTLQIGGGSRPVCRANCNQRCTRDS